MGERVPFLIQMHGWAACNTGEPKRTGEMSNECTQTLELGKDARRKVAPDIMNAALPFQLYAYLNGKHVHCLCAASECMSVLGCLMRLISIKECYYCVAVVSGQIKTAKLACHRTTVQHMLHLCGVLGTVQSGHVWYA